MRCARLPCYRSAHAARRRPTLELPPEAIDHALEHAPLARLATLRADGSAAQVPIVFARAESALWSPVDAKPKRGPELARLRHIERDPRVSLLIDAWRADWSELWWLRIEGRASVERAAPGGFESAAQALRAKYPQYRAVSLFHGTPTLLRIEITHTRSWCASEAAVRGVLSLGGAR